MNKDQNILIELGKNIKSAREKQGLTQETLGFKCDLHRTYIGMVERAEKNVTILSLYKIACALNVQITDLIPQNLD